MICYLGHMVIELLIRISQYSYFLAYLVKTHLNKGQIGVFTP